jgi:rhodanese-related sulfurtransferase
MLLTLFAAGAVLAGAAIGLRLRRLHNQQREMESHCIAPEELYALQSSPQKLLLYDVRLPLDVLANSEIIPGAQRIAPSEIMADPGLIPRDEDSVVYCTCPSDETSRAVLRRALATGHLRVKFLRGGLAGWKAKGYPVEPYTRSFHLDVAI